MTADSEQNVEIGEVVLGVAPDSTNEIEENFNDAGKILHIRCLEADKEPTVGYQSPTILNSKTKEGELTQLQKGLDQNKNSHTLHLEWRDYGAGGDVDKGEASDVQLLASLEYAYNAQKNGFKIYCNCKSGRGRSGLWVILYRVYCTIKENDGRMLNDETFAQLLFDQQAAMTRMYRPVVDAAKPKKKSKDGKRARGLRLTKLILNTPGIKEAGHNSGQNNVVDHFKGNCHYKNIVDNNYCNGAEYSKLTEWMMEAKKAHKQADSSSNCFLGASAVFATTSVAASAALVVAVKTAAIVATTALVAGIVGIAVIGLIIGICAIAYSILRRKRRKIVEQENEKLKNPKVAVAIEKTSIEAGSSRSINHKRSSSNNKVYDEGSSNGQFYIDSDDEGSGNNNDTYTADTTTNKKKCNCFTTLWWRFKRLLAKKNPVAGGRASKIPANILYGKSAAEVEKEKAEMKQTDERHYNFLTS